MFPTLYSREQGLLAGNDPPQERSCSSSSPEHACVRRGKSHSFTESFVGWDAEGTFACAVLLAECY